MSKVVRSLHNSYFEVTVVRLNMYIQRPPHLTKMPRDMGICLASRNKCINIGESCAKIIPEGNLNEKKE